MNLLNKIQSGGVYMIAEMSGNHNGDFDRAVEIVHAAKESGADCLKIQTYTADSMTIDCNNEYFKIHGGLWNGYNLYELYQKASTPYEWQANLKSECEKLDIDFLSTPFDKHGVDFLESLGVEAYKVSSFELVDIPLIRHIARKGKPMIVSCGMGEFDEIQDAMDTMLNEGLSREQIILMHCTSEYPANIENMNLLIIPDMIRKFGVTVGLSDHSIGSLAPVVAVTLGARVVEKHFCVSRSLGGVDSAFSLEQQEYQEMVSAVRIAVKSLGTVNYGASEGEKANLVFRRSIFAVDNINIGDKFTEQNIRIIRPGYGQKPKYYDALLGKISSKQYKSGEPIVENKKLHKI